MGCNVFSIVGVGRGVRRAIVSDERPLRARTCLDCNPRHVDFAAVERGRCCNEMFAECVACTDVKRPPGYASVVTHANLTERFNRNPPFRIPALVDRRRALVGLDVPIDTEELHWSLSEGTCERLDCAPAPGQCPGKRCHVRAWLRSILFLKSRLRSSLQGLGVPSRPLSWNASRGPLQWRHERRFRLPPHTAAAYPHSGSDARPVRSGATRLAQVLLRPKSIRARR